MNYSKQRELILDVVRHASTHPTAEEIYNGLKASQPFLSLATVYRNLNQLCAHQSLLRLHLPNSPDRYDARVQPHCHLRCEHCETIIDIDNPIDWERLLSGVQGHQINGGELVLFGICSDCLNAQKSKSQSGGDLPL
ncbi:MAG: transcriptional repressor [Oscillospiraceae bacterium]